MRTRIALGLALLMTAAAACSSGTLTVAEYADQTEVLVQDMAQRFTALDTDWLSADPTIERALDYWDRRLEIRRDFLKDIEDLAAPDEILPTHEQAVDIFTRFEETDEALAAVVADWETISSHWEWEDTPEGLASEALLEEVWAFCRSSQEQMDNTEQGAAFEGTPWVPAEMAEVVKVAYGCPPSDG